MEGDSIISLLLGYQLHKVVRFLAALVTKKEAKGGAATR